MNRMRTGWLAVLVSLAPAGSLLGHHSLVNFDTTTAVRVQGTIAAVHHINPHSFIFLDQIDTDGERRRWAVEGPSIFQLNRTGIAKDILKPGDAIEVCGYVPKVTVIWQLGSTDPAATSMSGRLINAELLVMPDGREQSWGDYGTHKCFAPGYKDQHSR